MKNVSFEVSDFFDTVHGHPEHINISPFDLIVLKDNINKKPNFINNDSSNTFIKVALKKVFQYRKNSFSEIYKMAYNQ